MEKNENAELEKAAVSARENVHLNKATAIIKLATGILTRDPVLASEGGHDLGDANVHGDHEKELIAESPEVARRFALKSARKLGAYTLIGAGVELAIENNWDHVPHPLIALLVATASLGINVWRYRNARQHTHERAHSLVSHTYWDQYVSGATAVNAAAILAGFNVSSAVGIATHVGLSFAPVVAIYRYKPAEIQPSHIHE